MGFRHCSNGRPTQLQCEDATKQTECDLHGFSARRGKCLVLIHQQDVSCDRSVRLKAARIDRRGINDLQDKLWKNAAIAIHVGTDANKRSLVASYRSLALLYPIGLWLLRLAIGDREPTATDVVNIVVNIVVALERGQGLTGLPRAATAMANTQQLERVIAWYAR